MRQIDGGGSWAKDKSLHSAPFSDVTQPFGGVVTANNNSAFWDEGGSTNVSLVPLPDRVTVPQLPNLGRRLARYVFTLLRV